MVDKYPNLSPYTYCANNPVRLVDEDGEEVVIIIGINENEKTRLDALNDLRNAAPNLNHILVGDNLLIGDGGEAKTKYEEQLKEAINSTKFKSEITLEYNDRLAGAYYGTTLTKEGQYVSKNSVNLFEMRTLEKYTGSVTGCGLMHEITEGFEMGKIAKRENLTHIEKAERKPEQRTIGAGRVQITIANDQTGPQYPLYEEGHSRATPQPGSWEAKPKRFFK